MTRRDAFERRMRGLVALLLHAYPRDFRARYGQDIAETSIDRLRAARASGTTETARFLVGAIADFLVSGARERLAPVSASSRMFHWQDVRYALRLLRRSPFFTVLTIAVLGGGLGLSIFTFSFLHIAMVRPLPLHEGERVVRIMEGRTGSIDAAEFAALRPALRTVTGVGAYSWRELILGSDGARRAVHAAAAEWNIFEVTRTPPMLGRGFRIDDERPGAEPVIVLGHRTWEVAFGSDPGIVGRLVPIDGVPTRVIGVMPAGYGFPVAADAWVPIPTSLLEARVPDVARVQAWARLAGGATTSSARSELETLLSRVRRERAAGMSGEAPAARVVVQSFQRAQIGDEAPLVFGVLNLLATLILLLACINVTNLLLARANERARETAVRLALGAPRARLILQGLWESVLLCVAGGVLATALAAWGLDAIDGWAQSNLEGNLAFWWKWRADGTTVLAAGAFVTLTLAVLGAATSLRATQVHINAVLADGGARTGGRREARTARVLVATQVGVVSVLMFFGVLSAIVAWRVAHLDVGFDTRHLLQAGVEPAADRQDTRAKRDAFWLGIHEALAAQPEIDAFVLRNGLADIGSRGGELVIDGDSLGGGARPTAYVQAAIGSLDVFGVGVIDGRSLSRDDGPSAPPVALVSRSLATRHWPGRSPIGARVRLSGLDAKEPTRTVVGVVEDMIMGAPLSRDRSPLAVWVPLRQVDAPYAVAIFRHRGNVAATRAGFHEAHRNVDPLLPVGSVQTFEEILGKSALLARSVTKLFAACFGFALLLAVSGTYGLMSRSIGQRTREIGVRRALGATDRVIVRLLLGQGARQLGVGALVALPFMLLVGVGFAMYVPIALPIATGAGVLVAATVIGVVLAATWLPTRRALMVTVRDALWRA
jgi:predicted permease